jgi:tetratricopeptide (TPR) repeat protein
MTTLHLRWRTSRSGGLPDAKTLPLLRQAVALAPDRVELRLQLARTLVRAGAHREVVDLLKPALAETGVDPELLLILGRAALAVGQDQLAADALDAAAARGVNTAEGYLAEALYRLNRHDEALRSARRRLSARPTDFEALQVVARVLFGRGEIERLWRLCLELQSNGAWGGWFSAVAASTAAALGLEHEFNRLCDRSRWFSAETLSVPDGFNERLGAELLALRPSRKAMRIDNLQEVGGQASLELFARLQDAVESYAAERNGLAGDVLMAHQPAHALLTGWAMLTETHQHHRWHLHQAGWISGVYYIQVPKIDQNRDGLAGGIEFGPYPFGGDEEKLRPYRWQVRTEAGLLIMFPSYFAHRTQPTGVPEPRLCVAFDVRPASPLRAGTSIAPHSGIGDSQIV